MGSKGLNTKQVGDLFGVDESTVRRWAMSGKIECTSSAGGHRKFSFKNIVAFSNSNGIKINSQVLKDSLDMKNSQDWSVDTRDGDCRSFCESRLKDWIPETE